MRYKIDGAEVFLDISGHTVRGENLCLLEKDDNLVSGCSWQDQGFLVSQMVGRENFHKLYRGVLALLLEALNNAGCKIDAGKFKLEHYHNYCPDQQTHLRVIEFLRSKASIENLPVNHSVMDEQVSQLCGKTVSCVAVNNSAAGYFFIRLVRPFPHKDNNPPHKDVWLDRLRHGLNLYFPLAGSDHNSSLSIVPGSHYWPESRILQTGPGSRVNGVAFSVPSAVMDDGTLTMTRPVIRETEGMIFSPYLIHGGAVNFSDKTRVSLEMRFWRLG
ncbi:MAG: hypothetical protein V7688_01360 [Alcanivorax jadensis]|uniref:hypothetical protein n=1 Tax=Alcanivorax jadensis TaxID=64988 RepID=UPI003001019C